jgi:hypothetical protein
VAEGGGEGYFPSEPVSTGSIGILCRPCRAETGRGNWMAGGVGGGGGIASTEFIGRLYRYTVLHKKKDKKQQILPPVFI